VTVNSDVNHDEFEAQFNVNMSSRQLKPTERKDNWKKGDKLEI
jgi:hypothetical protein